MAKRAKTVGYAVETPNALTQAVSTLPTPKKVSSFTPDLVIAEQLKRSCGNVSHAAKMLGLDRSGLHYRINRSQMLAQLIIDARETIVDAAENSLHAAVIRQEPWATCFTLKTLGRKRGYVERQEIEYSESQATMEHHSQLFGQAEQLLAAFRDAIAKANASLDARAIEQAAREQLQLAAPTFYDALPVIDAETL